MRMFRRQRDEKPAVAGRQAGGPGNVSHNPAPLFDEREYARVSSINHVFEKLWQEAGGAGGARAVVRGRNPQGLRAILFRTIGLRRVAVVEQDNNKLGFQVQMIDGKGTNPLVAADGVIAFKQPIPSQNLHSLLTHIDDWVDACDVIYGFGAGTTCEGSCVVVPPPVATPREPNEPGAATAASTTVRNSPDVMAESECKIPGNANEPRQ